ncbi:MAG: sigma-54-dependent Fis family transcriptional regulator [Betaproteobacteria bacterium]|nr:sigma-54-dependent Fis family transcriptional regulator [Betaproteobacteria bacterium]
MKPAASDSEPLARTRAGLLLVDDDPLITETLSFALGADYEVHACDSRAAAIEVLRRLATPPPLALVDLGLPPTPHSPEEGFQLIGELLAHAPAMRIFVLSGQNDAANARHARTLGAWEFVAKPAEPALLKRLLTRALETPTAAEGGLVGESPALLKLKSQIAQFAPAPYPVLIEGESGSGKEFAARSLHRLSARAARPYLTVNCAAIAPALVEPTLFGYAKGAFTGATSNKAGCFEDAQDGTLLLDEIGELTQRRMARCRVLAATNRDLRSEVRKGAFRPDLYHRLSVFTLSVPALRDMEGDKRRLLGHFSRLMAAQSGRPAFELEPGAAARWEQYDFPGNVRELRNIVIRLATKFPGQRLSSAELEAEFDLTALPRVATQAAAAMTEQALRQLQRAGAFNLDETLKAWERGYIEAALRLTRGNVSQAARLLGINRTTLYSRMSTTQEK